MVVVVADPALESRGRAGRLNAADETFGRQQRQGVIDGLQRDGAELRANRLGDAVGGDVRMQAHGPQHGETLRGHLNAAFAKGLGLVGNHGDRLYQSLESLQIRREAPG